MVISRQLFCHRYVNTLRALIILNSGRIYFLYAEMFFLAHTGHTLNASWFKCEHCKVENRALYSIQKPRLCIEPIKHYFTNKIGVSSKTCNKGGCVVGNM